MAQTTSLLNLKKTKPKRLEGIPNVMDESHEEFIQHQKYLARSLQEKFSELKDAKITVEEIAFEVIDLHQCRAVQHDNENIEKIKKSFETYKFDKDCLLPLLFKYDDVTIAVEYNLITGYHRITILKDAYFHSTGWFVVFRIPKGVKPFTKTRKKAIGNFANQDKSYGGKAMTDEDVASQIHESITETEGKISKNIVEKNLLSIISKHTKIQVNELHKMKVWGDIDLASLSEYRKKMKLLVRKRFKTRKIFRSIKLDDAVKMAAEEQERRSNEKVKIITPLFSETNLYNQMKTVTRENLEKIDDVDIEIVFNLTITGDTGVYDEKCNIAIETHANTVIWYSKSVYRNANNIWDIQGEPSEAFKDVVREMRKQCKIRYVTPMSKEFKDKDVLVPIKDIKLFRNTLLNNKYWEKKIQKGWEEMQPKI